MEFGQANLDCLQAFRAVLGTNHVANVNQVAGNVAATAIDRDMSVPDQLPSLGPRQAKAQAAHDIIQAPFQEAHQRLAGVSLSSNGPLVVPAELALQYTVIALDLLFFAEMNSIVGQLAAASGHTRGILAPLDGAFWRVAAGSLQEQLHPFAAAQAANG